MDKRCSNCKHNRASKRKDNETEYLCSNLVSENFGSVTAYDDVCYDWEKRE